MQNVLFPFSNQKGKQDVFILENLGYKNHIDLSAPFGVIPAT